GMAPEGYGLQDEPGMPRLERLLRACPHTTVIGHGPGFWSEMSADVTMEQKWSYPKGPLKGRGATWRLLRECPNLYADLSAMSGYNAITRDPEAGLAFLHEFSGKLLYGSDTCFADAQGYVGHKEHLDGLRARGELADDAYSSIMSINALRLLGED
ncbi:MAG: amidohydrolase family protein, partial [Chloroflexi bacterium]|nr:amidohydrolase family protein [Chloroflexota bacterium]